MFRTSLRPSSEAHDDSVGYLIGRLVLELLLVGGRMECTDRGLLQPSVRTLHPPSNQQQPENQMAYVVTNAIVVSS